jgi:CDP-2,3-bis-(O-geranylgeranyl)-sn-glycerol synthase
MLKELFFVWWFFAPSGVANIAAFFSGKNKYLKKYSYPADFYLRFRDKRVLGDHKTIRGFVFGTLSSIAIVYIQIYLYNSFDFLHDLVLIDYNSINPILFGFLSGFGALFGDSVKSFFKRQVNIKPGKSWIPFDQIDYILGGILFTSFYISLNTEQYVYLFLVWFLLHPLTTVLGYLFKLKEEPL